MTPVRTRHRWTRLQLIQLLPLRRRPCRVTPTSAIRSPPSASKNLLNSYTPSLLHVDRRRMSYVHHSSSCSCSLWRDSLHACTRRPVHDRDRPLRRNTRHSVAPCKSTVSSSADLSHSARARAHTPCAHLFCLCTLSPLQCVRFMRTRRSIDGEVSSLGASSRHNNFNPMQYYRYDYIRSNSSSRVSR